MKDDRIDKNTQISNELAGIMALAWRCLYAEIVDSRKNSKTLSTDKAYKRLISMVHSRTTAEANRWKKWAERSEHQRKELIIPLKHREKTIYSQDPMGSYEIAGVIRRELDT